MVRSSTAFQNFKSGQGLIEASAALTVELNALYQNRKPTGDGGVGTLAHVARRIDFSHVVPSSSTSGRFRRPAESPRPARGKKHKHHRPGATDMDLKTLQTYQVRWAGICAGANAKPNDCRRHGAPPVSAAADTDREVEDLASLRNPSHG